MAGSGSGGQSISVRGLSGIDDLICLSLINEEARGVLVGSGISRVGAGIGSPKVDGACTGRGDLDLPRGDTRTGHVVAKTVNIYN